MTRRSFPDVNVADVEHAERRSYEQFHGRPIRDFVPVFLERMARNELAGDAHRLAWPPHVGMRCWHRIGT